MSPVLAEFCCYYTYCGKEDSSKYYSLFIERVETIEESDVRMTESENKLPLFILLSNGDVLKHKKPKVLKYKISEEGTIEYLRAKVALFRLTENFDELSDEDVSRKYAEVDDATGLQIVINNENKFYEQLGKQ